MLAHRFRDSWTTESARPAGVIVAAGGVSAFVLCPWPVAAAQQLQAEYLYRVAYEQAQAEVARERQARWSAFSRN